MASAGQAHAHSSQPTHFSSPSGCRLSWWRPWNRGWVGTFCSGYSSVTTSVNMVRNVTPKPATEANSPGASFWSATAHLLVRLGVVAQGGLDGGGTGRRRLAVRVRRQHRAGAATDGLAGPRRHRVPALERVDLRRDDDPPGRGGLLVAAAAGEEGPQHERHDQHQAG